VTIPKPTTDQSIANPDRLNGGKCAIATAIINYLSLIPFPNIFP
jgi:hypothetical protein